MILFVLGIEKMVVCMLDILYWSDVNIEVVDKRLLVFNYVIVEEIKMMINLFRFKYIILIIGEYCY